MPKITVNSGTTYEPWDEENYAAPEPVEESEDREPVDRGDEEVGKGEPDPPPAKPAINSPKADWVAYGIYMDPDRDTSEIENYTKAQLINKYG